MCLLQTLKELVPNEPAAHLKVSAFSVHTLRGCSRSQHTVHPNMHPSHHTLTLPSHHTLTLPFTTPSRSSLATPPSHSPLTTPHPHTPLHHTPIITPTPCPHQAHLRSPPRGLAKCHEAVHSYLSAVRARLKELNVRQAPSLAHLTPAPHCSSASKWHHCDVYVLLHTSTAVCSHSSPPYPPHTLHPHLTLTTLHPHLTLTTHPTHPSLSPTHNLHGVGAC